MSWSSNRRVRTAVAMAMAVIAVEVAVDALPAHAITGGTVVSETSFSDDWSFVVGVGRAIDGAPWCTGSLVGADMVITAAHCVTPTSPDTVWYGAPDLDDASTVSIEAIHINPAYDASSGDTAILRLADPLVGVTPVRVVTSAEAAGLATPLPVSLAGFGLTESGWTSVLHEAVASAIRSRTHWTVTGVPNGCRGDSGGPLVTLLSGGDRVLIGATSLGDSATCPTDSSQSVRWTNLGNDTFVQAILSGEPPPTVPVLNFTVTPTSGAAPLTVAFDMTGSGYGDDRPTTFEVDPRFLLSSGQYSQAVVRSGTPIRTTYTYTQPGTYQAVIGFNDGTANQRYEIVTITVTEPPPTPVLHYTATPTAGAAPLTVAFDMAGSGYGDGRATTFVVDPLHDTATSERSPAAVAAASPVATTYVYTQPGVYHAFVGFTDGTPFIHYEIVTITVTEPPPPPPPPTPQLRYTVSSTTGYAPLTVRFDLAGSAMSDGSLAVYFVDPTYDTTTSTYSPALQYADAPFATTFTYTVPGTYQARVGIESDTVEKSTSELITIVVKASPAFEPPVNEDVANKAKAGQTIPFKFSVIGETGPVTDLTDATVSSTTYACPAQPTGDVVENYATSQAGTLINLGRGRYQYNWKTPRSWAGSCRTLTIDVGDGPRTADFEFVR